jgi:hypothetical protein
MSILGRFYFKLTDSKNLIGEFSNCNSNGNYTQSADLDPEYKQKPEDGKFSGQYYTTWHDDCNRHEAVLSKLEIKKKDECENIFCLTWRDDKGSLRFRGEGMLCDGMLIGDYHDLPKEASSGTN